MKKISERVGVISLLTLLLAVFFLGLFKILSPLTHAEDYPLAIISVLSIIASTGVEAIWRKWKAKGLDQ